MTVKPSKWQAEERASHKGRTNFSSPPSPPSTRGFLMSDVKCTSVINITPQLSLGAGSVGRSGLGDSISPGPHTGSFELGFQLPVPEKAGGEARVNH